MSAGLAFVTALAALPAGAQDTAEDLRETREELGEAREDLEQVTVEAERASEELRLVERRLADAAATLRVLEDEVELATAAWERARDASQDSAREVASADARVAEAEDELAARQDRLDDQVRSAYMYTPRVPSRLTVAQLVADNAGQPDDVLHGAELIERLASGGADDVADMDELRLELVERKAQLAEVRAQLADQEAVAQRLRTEVEATRDRQRVAQAAASADRWRQGELVGQLEAAKESYEEQITSLEAESERLEEVLRASQWRAGAPGKGTLVWPTNGNPGSPFGYRIHPIYGTRRLHTGVDIGAPTGQQIVAAADGLVVEAGWKGGYGNAVVIDHGGGVATLYAHQSRLAVSAGTVVTQGQVIGYIGSTGASTGPHLHLEVRVNGVPQDPMGWY